MSPTQCFKSGDSSWRRVANLTNQELQALRATGQALDVAFQIGKSGVTDGVVKELQQWLLREPLVKVRILKSAQDGDDGDTEALARDLAARARVTFVEVRGHTALFHRPPRHKRSRDDF